MLSEEEFELAEQERRERLRNIRIADLERQLAEAQKDAERYRWLRQAGWIDDAIMDANDICDDDPESLDAAIDRARGGEV